MRSNRIKWVKLVINSRLILVAAVIILAIVVWLVLAGGSAGQSQTGKSSRQPTSAAPQPALEINGSPAGQASQAQSGSGLESSATAPAINQPTAVPSSGMPAAKDGLYTGEPTMPEQPYPPCGYCEPGPDRVCPLVGSSYKCSPCGGLYQPDSTYCLER